MRKAKDYIVLFIKGIAMGGADVVPGVSGGTIAFISGIYEELLESINSINLQNLKLLKDLQIKEFWSAINGNFLLVLFSGIIISLLSLARLISYLIENNPIQLWSFFLGLILASAIIVLRKIKTWNIGVAISIIIGTTFAYYLTTFVPINSGDNYIGIFFSGVIAITAMILPGISGSFILLILGKYELMVNAIKDFKIGLLFIFAAGCLVGLLSFSRVISWVLKKYHNVAIAVLSGFMIGSLGKIWPWKEVLQYRLNSIGEQVPIHDRNIMPNQFLEITGNDPHFLYALLFILVGILGVILFERIATWSSSKY